MRATRLEFAAAGRASEEILMNATLLRHEALDVVRSEGGARKVGENPLGETLCERVEELLRSHKSHPLLFTAGSRSLLEELAARSVGLEEAVREIALEVQQVVASRKGI